MSRYLFASLAAILATTGFARGAEPGVYANVEFLLLSAQIPSVGFDNFFYREADADVFTEGTIGDDLNMGLRTVVGAEDCCGFGGRFRWFTFDQDYDYNGLWNNGVGTTAIGGGLNIDVDAIDIEFTQRGEFCRWDLVGSAGLRYASLDITNNDIDFGVIAAALFTGAGIGGDYEGIGPTLSLAGTRELGCSGFSLYASGRNSLLFGETDIVTPFFPGGTIVIQNDFAHVTEVQLGLNYERCLNRCADLNAGVFWEAQRWDSALGDIAFVGLGMRAGLTY